MSTPKTFEEAIRAALEMTARGNHGLKNPTRGYELVHQTDMLLCFCKVVWESVEDLRQRVADLERCEQERRDDGR